MIALLTVFAPLFLQLGLKLVAFFEGDADKKIQNQKTFLSLLSAHVEDAQKSVEEKLSYQDQVKKMEDQNGKPPTV